MLRACGKHFRLLYGTGIWLSRSEASAAIDNGWAMLAPRLDWDLGCRGYHKHTASHLSWGLSPKSFGCSIAYKAGYMLLAQRCAQLKWALFKIRPKLHMQAEIVWLIS